MGFEKFAKAVLVVEVLLGFLGPFFRWQPLNYASTFLLLLVNAVCVIYFFSEEKRPILRRFGVLLIIFCGLTIFNWLRSPKYYMGSEGLASTSHEMTVIVRNLTTIFLVYRLTMKKLLSAKYLHDLAFIFFILTIPAYLLDYNSLEYSKFGHSVNAAYTLIYIFFMLSICGFEIRNTIYFAIVFGFAILSAKRGAMVSAGIVSVFYLLYRWRKKWTRFLLIPLAVGLMFILGNYVYSNNENLQLKIEGTREGNTSGREYMNEVLILNFYKQDIDGKLFGSAFAGSFDLLDMDAHNDYLEILTGQGVLGLSIYIIILFYFLFIFFKGRSYMAPHEKFIILSGTLMWYVRAFVSQTVYGNETIIFIITFTFIVAGLPYETFSRRIKRKKYIGKSA